MGVHKFHFQPPPQVSLPLRPHHSNSTAIPFCSACVTYKVEKPLWVGVTWPAVDQTIRSSSVRMKYCPTYTHNKGAIDRNKKWYIRKFSFSHSIPKTYAPNTYQGDIILPCELRVCCPGMTGEAASHIVKAKQSIDFHHRP